MTGIIYLAVNSVNGKAYVGQTTYDLGVRVEAHWSKRKHPRASHFQRSLNFHGLDSYDFAVLETCTTKLELNEAERKWIKLMGSIQPDGYNFAAGGEGSLANKRSEAWHKAVRSPLTRYRHSVRAKAWRASQTPEQKAAHQAKINATKVGQPMPWMMGQNNPANKMINRINISEGLKKSWQDPEVRARRAAAQLRRKQRESNS